MAFDLYLLLLLVYFLQVTFHHGDVGAVKEVQISQEGLVAGQGLELAPEDIMVLERPVLTRRNADNVTSEVHSQGVHCSESSLRVTEHHKRTRIDL